MSISRSNKLACMLVVAMTLASCNLDIPKEVQSSFETMTIEKSDIVLPIKFSAKMKGKADVTITPQVSGQLTKICVTEGQRVGVGTVLFVIDQRNAQHEVEAAQANLQAAIASENSASLEYQSNKNLFDKKIVSTYMLENSLNTYKQAQAAVSQARAAVTQAQASLNRAKVNLGFCTITSPVVGVIGEIPVFAGDQVSPGTQLTIVSGNTTMDAEFSITESFLVNQLSSGTVKEADKSRVMAALPDVQFVLKNGVQYPYGGRVTSLTGVVNAATGSLACKASFPNPDGHLFSGMQGTVVIPIQKKDVMVIPINAVVRLQDKSLVYKVMPDSTAKSVEVTITNTDSGKDVIINSGLNTGDVIVTTGANNVQEGQKVLFPKEEESEKKD